MQQAADDVEPVRTAPQRQRWVVVGDLPGQSGVVGHVGRVGHHDVDRALEVAQQVRVGHVPGQDGDRGVPRRGARSGVEPGPGDRVGVPLDRGDPGPRVLLRDRQRDGPRAGAQVDHHRVLPQLREHPAGDLLGLGPRHEDPGAHRQLQVPEGGRPGEVLQRHPGGPLLQQGPEPGGVRDVVQGDQPGAGQPQRVGEQQLGVHPRGLDAGRGQPGGGLGQQRARVQLPASSSSAVCAVTSASMTASRSPSSTASRLCALNPTRWSEIRFSG